MPRELCSNFGGIFCWEKMLKKSLDAISARYCGSYAQILVGYFIRIKYKKNSLDAISAQYCGSYAQILVGYFVGMKYKKNR